MTIERIPGAPMLAVPTTREAPEERATTASPQPVDVAEATTGKRGQSQRPIAASPPAPRARDAQGPARTVNPHPPVMSAELEGEPLARSDASRGQEPLLRAQDSITKTFGERLKAHLESFDVTSYMQSDATSLQRTSAAAGNVELLCGDDFRDLAPLYNGTFPPSEREETADIIDRLQAQALGKREGQAPFYLLCLRDKTGRAVAGAHFSVLPLNDGEHAVAYLQYIYTDKKSRNHGFYKLLQQLVMATAAASTDKELVGTLFETEMPNQGDTKKARAFTLDRLRIHKKAGAQILTAERDGKVYSLHRQPGLAKGDPSLALYYAFIQSPLAKETNAEALVPQMLQAFNKNFLDEDFPPGNVERARKLVGLLLEGASVRFVDPEKAPTYGEVARDDASLRPQFNEDRQVSRERIKVGRRSIFRRTKD